MRELLQKFYDRSEETISQMTRLEFSNLQLTVAIQQLAFWNSQMHEIINATVDMATSANDSYIQLSELVVEKFNSLVNTLNRIVRVE